MNSYELESHSQGGGRGGLLMGAGMGNRNSTMQGDSKSRIEIENNLKVIE